MSIPTRPQLREWLESWSCACGDPESAYSTLRDLLRLMDSRSKGRWELERWKQIENYFNTPGLMYFVLYILDNMKLIEHGSSIGGSWLTERGQEVLDALNEVGDDWSFLDSDD